MTGFGDVRASQAANLLNRCKCHQIATINVGIYDHKKDLVEER